jgi:hypothetical protein
MRSSLIAGQRRLVEAAVFYLLYVNRVANFFLYCVICDCKEWN